MLCLFHNVHFNAHNVNYTNVTCAPQTVPNQFQNVVNRFANFEYYEQLAPETVL